MADGAFDEHDRVVCHQLMADRAIGVWCPAVCPLLRRVDVEDPRERVHCGGAGAGVDPGAAGMKEDAGITWPCSAYQRETAGGSAAGIVGQLRILGSGGDVAASPR